MKRFLWFALVLAALAVPVFARATQNESTTFMPNVRVDWSGAQKSPTPTRASS